MDEPPAKVSRAIINNQLFCLSQPLVGTRKVNYIKFQKEYKLLQADIQICDLMNFVEYRVCLVPGDDKTAIGACIYI